MGKVETGVVNIRGKEYKTVSLRVEEFRAACPLADGWGIRTTMVEVSSDQVLMRAEVVSPSGAVVATGHAHETWEGQINRTSAVENCETSAIGRALASAGFGGSEFASANEVGRAVQPQAAGHTNKPKAPRLRDTIIAHVAQAKRLDQMGTFTAKIAAHEEAERLTAEEARECRAQVAARTAALASAESKDHDPSELFDRSPEPVGV